jgi:hypothetical protein
VASNLEQIYAYPGRSRVDAAGIALATSRGGHGATVSGTDAVDRVAGADIAGATTEPFFRGFMQHPAVVAAALLVVARVARTRFYVPPGMLAARLRAADPVITASRDGLRFEAFSVCCGVAVRLDVDAAALEAERLRPGVTNVDVNPELRQALAGLLADEPLQLEVADDALAVATLDARVVEERVALPTRWLRGFAETQVIQRRMVERIGVEHEAARRLLAALPTSTPTRSLSWVAPTPDGGVRLAGSRSPGAVALAGAERLGVLAPLLRFAGGLRAFASETASSEPQASAWVLELPGARVTLVVSAEKSRGFSGEGAVLSDLATPHAAEDADSLRELLATTADPGDLLELPVLVRASGIPADRVEAALTGIAMSGLLGWDLHRASWFLRPLPFSARAMTELNPRLSDARHLVAVGAVEPSSSGDFTVGAGSDGEAGARHVVRLAALGSADVDRCTCPWFGRHRGARGECRHVLAARLARDAASGGLS